MTWENSAEGSARSAACGQVDNEARLAGGRVGKRRLVLSRASRSPHQPGSAPRRPQPRCCLSGQCAAPAGGVAMVSGGSRGRAPALPPARRGGAGAGRPGWGRATAAAGAGGAGDAASPPGAALALPPPPQRAAARRELRAGPAGLPGPSAPHSQRVAPPAPSALARQPRGPRPVPGGGEGGAQAPAVRETG